MGIEILMTITGIIATILGTIGRPSDLDKPVNTATIVFLWGLTLFLVGIILISQPF